MRKGFTLVELLIVFGIMIVVGAVVNVVRNSPGFFQLVEIKPAVDFSKLEEVFVVIP